MQVLRPTSLAEALDMMAAADRPLTPIAGGTDLLVSWHHRVKDDLRLLDLSRLRRGLGPMLLTEDALGLGALTTYWDVMRSTEAGAAFPLLPEVARQVGAVQIQTRGTWAGNIANASPAADGVPVMMAYAAIVGLAAKCGGREVRLDEYYTGYKQTIRRPDELIVAIHVPRRTRDVEWFHKVGARSGQAISKVVVAVVHDECGWRVVAGAVAPVVCRCRNMEAALENGFNPSSPDDVQSIIQQDITPIDDMRSTAAYRTRVLSRLLFFRLTERRRASA